MAAVPVLAQTTNVTDVYNPTATTVAASVESVTLTSYTADKARLTIPVNQTSSAATSVRVTLGGGQATLVNSTTNFIDPDYYITNYYDLNPAVATLNATGVPAGAGVAFGSQSITNISGDEAQFDVVVTLNFTNVASGDYDVAVEAAGANTWRYPVPVKAGYVWSGGGGAGNIAFSSAANWVGGVVPGAGDIVIVDNAGAVSGATTPTIGVTANTTIGSVSDIHTGDNYTHWNIGAGATLSILGDGGFRQLVDIIDVNERSRIRASGAGTLIVSNANADFNFITSRQNTSYDNADFSALNKLVLDVRRIAFNDISAYPNIGTNGIMNRPFRNVYDMDWALTNILRATHTDANGWTNETRDYGIVINRQNVSGQTGSDGGMHFGLWNELYVDSILFGGYSQMENPEVDFRSTGSYMKIRNTDGVSRVSNLTIADAADYFASGDDNSGGTKIDVSFTRGTVDALIDTLILGREPSITANGPANGKLFLGAGTFDVNNAFIGYQTGPGIGTESGAAEGRLDVTTGGTFRVNDTLYLGYLTTNNAQTVGTFGQLNISGGGIAEVNAIQMGGPLHDASQANNISVSGGTLVVSNSLGSASRPANALTLANSTLVLHADAADTEPYVHTKTLTIGGTGNTIRLASVTGFTTYPATIPLIAYTGSAAPNFSLELPAGLFGYIVNNTGNSTIDAVITTTPPADLVWNGVPNGNWDDATPNWKGNATFSNGDTVTFDDTATGSTAITVVGSVIPGPGGVLVSNMTKAYSLSGGFIDGTATMTKRGAQSLTVDATSSLPLLVQEGAVTGMGTLGFATVSTGALLDYTGTVNGLSSAGETVISGTVNIAATVTGGTLVNSGTVNGTVNFSGGAITNTGVINSTGGNSTMGAAILVNNGDFNNVNGRLTVGSGGVLSGTGSIVDPDGGTFQTGVDGRLVVSSGGKLEPGTNSINEIKVWGRLDLNNGSLTEIEVDMNHPSTNDVVATERWSTLQGTIHMKNIGAVPFAVGQSFKVFRNLNGDAVPNNPDNSNHIPVMYPLAPGLGMQWDLSDVRTNGIVRIVAGPTTPPTFTGTFTGGTNLTMTWPNSHVGFQMQVQTNALSVGLSNNWVGIPGSELTNRVDVAIDPEAPAVFYRLSNQ